MFNIYQFFSDFYGITLTPNAPITSDVVIALLLTVIFCEFIIRLAEVVFSGCMGIFRR